LYKLLKNKPMAVCSNCKKSLSCGCQKRKASDGTSVCTNCISAYEKKTNITTTSITPIVQKEMPKKWSMEEIQAGIERLNSWKNKFKS